MRKEHAVDYLFVLAFALMLAYQVLVSPIVGMANNGDFRRMMGSAGLSFVDKNDAGFKAFPRYYTWDLRSRGKPFPSSELLFVGAGLALSKVVAKSGLVDVVDFGIAHALAYLPAFGLIAYTFSKSRTRYRWLLYLVILAIFGDVAYVGYFNSLYAEPATVIFLCISVAIAVTAASRWETGHGYRLLLIGFLISSVLFSVAKLQNLSMSPFLAYLLYRLSRLPADGSLGLRRTGNLLTLGLILVSLTTLAVYEKFPMGIRNTNMYIMVFHGILPYSPNPKADLKALGLDEGLVRYTGTHAWSPGVTKEVRDSVYHAVHEQGVMLFYIQRPRRLLDLLQRTAHYAPIMRPGYLGNFDTEEAKRIAARWRGHRPRAGEDENSDTVNLHRLPSQYLSNTFSGFSSLKERFAGAGVWYLVVFYFANILAVGVKMAFFDKNQQGRMLSALHASLIAMSIVQYLQAVIGSGGLDLVKHLFQFNLLCDVCLVFLAAYLLYMLFEFPKRRRGLMTAG